MCEPFWADDVGHTRCARASEKSRMRKHGGETAKQKAGHELEDLFSRFNLIPTFWYYLYLSIFGIYVHFAHILYVKTK